MEILELAIVAAAITAFVQFVKGSSGLGAWGIRILVIALSLGAGVAFYFVQDTRLWTAFIQVLGLANTAYLFLVRPFEE